MFYGDELFARYGHMLAGSASSILLQQIMKEATSVGMTKLWLPAGTQIGQTSYSGYVIPDGPRGTHLHFELGLSWWM